MTAKQLNRIFARLDLNVQLRPATAQDQRTVGSSAHWVIDGGAYQPRSGYPTLADAARYILAFYWDQVDLTRLTLCQQAAIEAYIPTPVLPEYLARRITF